MENFTLLMATLDRNQDNLLNLHSSVCQTCQHRKMSKKMPKELMSMNA